MKGEKQQTIRQDWGSEDFIGGFLMVIRGVSWSERPSADSLTTSLIAHVPLARSNQNSSVECTVLQRTFINRLQNSYRL